MILNKYDIGYSVLSSLDTSMDETPEPSGKVTSEIISMDRRGVGHTVFHVDENTFTTSQPRTSHWSIAWSDLMMTMFILFLSMFVYQLAEEEFLQEGGREILGGDTTEALQVLEDDTATLPFPPIKGGLSLIATGTIKKIEPIPTPEEEFASVEVEKPGYEPTTIAPEDTVSQQTPDTEDEITSIFDQKVELPTMLPQVPAQAVPAPPKEEPQATVPDDSFQEIYRLSKGALERNNLDKFAAIDIVPDKTVRIILTGDLLFDLGKSDLSYDAEMSLYKIGNSIKETPYMINVVGHTDNIPMASIKYKNNWELSLARANTVAQFLIYNIGMNPNQFVVSGFASYRPTVPNDSSTNRARNRRVEIIISKRLPTPQPATPQNLN